MGEGMAYGGLPFPGTACPVLDVYVYYVSDTIIVLNAVSALIHLPRMFLFTEIAFEQRTG